jgi:hypothetical protein
MIGDRDVLALHQRPQENLCHRVSFGSTAEVVGPPELRQMVREELKLMKA